MLTAEVVSIGTELLLGQIVDTDAAYLAQQLSALGIAVYHRATVGDNLERAIETVRRAVDRADIVFLIGGLGPTMDDLTRDIMAAVLDAPLQRDPAIVAHLRDFFARRGYPMVESNFRQADVPEGGRPLPNVNGTAPGLILEKGAKTLIALPGPPNEFVPLFGAEVLPVSSAADGQTGRAAGDSLADAAAGRHRRIDGGGACARPDGECQPDGRALCQARRGASARHSAGG